MKYVAGDLIEATKDETVIRGRLEQDGFQPDDLELSDAGWRLDNLEHDGFTVELIERAPASLPADITDQLVEVVECIQPSAYAADEVDSPTTRDVKRARAILADVIERHGWKS